MEKILEAAAALVNRVELIQVRSSLEIDGVAPASIRRAARMITAHRIGLSNGSKATDDFYVALEGAMLAAA